MTDRPARAVAPAPVRPATVLRLSPRVYVHAPGAPVVLPHADAIALAQRPGAAFGDGRHPTTRLCAGAVDLLARQLRPRGVLDVGTGTGILARIARARGAGLVVATDVDPDALAAARDNAGLDAHAAPMVIEDGPPDRWGARFDLVVANILEAVLRALAPALTRALTPAGTLLLSGVTPVQSPALRAAFAAEGLECVREPTLDGWALLMLRRCAP